MSFIEKRKRKSTANLIVWLIIRSFFWGIGIILFAVGLSGDTPQMAIVGFIMSGLAGSAASKGIFSKAKGLTNDANADYIVDYGKGEVREVNKFATVLLALLTFVFAFAVGVVAALVIGIIDFVVLISRARENSKAKKNAAAGIVEGAVTDARYQTDTQQYADGQTAQPEQSGQQYNGQQPAQPQNGQPLDAQAAQPQYQQYGQQYNVQQQGQPQYIPQKPVKEGNGMAVTAFVFGLLTTFLLVVAAAVSAMRLVRFDEEYFSEIVNVILMLFLFPPVFGFFAIPFGAVGAAKSKKVSGKGKGFAIFGLIVGSLSIILAIAVIGMAFYIMK